MTAQQHEHLLRDLEESEERFRVLADAAFEAIAISANGRVLAVNPGFLELFGYDREEVLGMAPKQFHPPEYQAIVERMNGGCDETPYQTVCLRKDGTTFHAEIRGKAMPLEGRKVRVTAIRDVTHYKDCEQRLRDVQESLEQAVRERTRDLTIANQQLTEKISELEMFEQAVVGRELKMIELQRENEHLRLELRQPFSERL